MPTTSRPVKSISVGLSPTGRSNSGSECWRKDVPGCRRPRVAGESDAGHGANPQPGEGHPEEFVRHPNDKQTHDSEATAGIIPATAPIGTPSPSKLALAYSSIQSQAIFRHGVAARKNRIRKRHPVLDVCRPRRQSIPSTGKRPGVSRMFHHCPLHSGVAKMG